jgi:hypothetical protein
MQIASVLGRYADATAGGQRPEVAQRTGARAADTSTARGLSAPPETALRTIMADYDLTRITPQKFSEMLDRLHKGGVLTDEEFTQLSQIRLDLDHEGIDAKESVDLLDLYSQRTQQLTRQTSGQMDDAAGRASLAAAQRRLDWLQKLALVHSAPDSVGLDTLA